MSAGERSALLMFAKAPEPGRVKTRLAAELGAESAAALQAAFLDDLAERFAEMATRRVLAASPGVEHPAFDAAREAGWEVVEQGEGDLGERLARQFDGLVGTAQRVVCIGSDSPTLPRALVEEAFAALARVEVVTAPSFDGGYVLIGARGRGEPLFEGVPWGTERVFDVTVRRLAAAGVPFEVLPFWYDVDDLRSLRGMANHLGVTGPYGPIEAPRTARRLVELGLARANRGGGGVGLDWVGREG